MIGKDDKNFKTSDKQDICGQNYQHSVVAVKRFCQATDKYRGSGHTSCIPDYKTTKTSLLCFII